MAIKHTEDFKQEAGDLSSVSVPSPIGIFMWVPVKG